MQTVLHNCLYLRAVVARRILEEVTQRETCYATGDIK